MCAHKEILTYFFSLYSLTQVSEKFIHLTTQLFGHQTIIYYAGTSANTDRKIVRHSLIRDYGFLTTGPYSIATT